MARALRVLIAPDKYKGTLSAHAATNAIARAVREAAAKHNIEITTDPCPIADGGEGTAEIIASMWNGDALKYVIPTTGPLGDPVEAPIWAGPDERAAAFDSASACGLHLVPAADRDPTRCTTLGVGLVIAVLAKWAPSVTIALGGSATVDGGIGLAAALGWRFDDRNGRAFNAPTGADLQDIARAIPPAEFSPTRLTLHDRRIRVLCDVSTPLLGDQGCAALFGPQKGATPKQVKHLDEGLRHLVDIVGLNPTERDGAAGGLAYGLRAFLAPLVESLTLESGANAVLDAVRFESRVKSADLIITGEGRYDRTSNEGKAVGEVIATAHRAGKPVLVIAGSAESGIAVPPGVTITTCEGDALPDDDREATNRLRTAAAVAFGSWLNSHIA